MSQLLTTQQFKICSLFISLYVFNWEIIQLYIDLKHFKSILHIWYVTWLIALFSLQFRIAKRVFSFSQVIRAKWTRQELLHCHQFVRSIRFWHINVPLWAKLWDRWHNQSVKWQCQWKLKNDYSHSFAILFFYFLNSKPHLHFTKSHYFQTCSLLTNVLVFPDDLFSQATV